MTDRKAALVPARARSLGAHSLYGANPPILSMEDVSLYNRKQRRVKRAMAFPFPPVYTVFMSTLPEQFSSVSLTALPPEERPALLHALTEGRAARGLRLRPGVSLPTIQAALGGTYDPIPWARDAYYIAADSRAGSHPLHAAGAYYLQEPSAMAAVGLLDVQPGQRALDLCAAPGGKSTQIAALLRGEGVLVSNEPVPQRARVLSQNIERMGVANAVVVSEMPDKLAARWGPWFDRVLVDAPCSGEGMFRRDPDTRAEWTAQSPQGCAARQMHILDSGAALLRPGGVLVYSTCTFNTIENEGVVEAFLQGHPSFLLEETARLWPHRVRGEGHFVAKLRKMGMMDALPQPQSERIPLGCFLPELGSVTVPGRHVPVGSRHWAMPLESPPLDGIRALRTGLALFEQRGHIYLPDHALAMSQPAKCWPFSHEVNDVQAQAFLRGETLAAPGAPKGFTVITYGGLCLGWGKCVDGVLKNHLPKGLRIHT